MVKITVDDKHNSKIEILKLKMLQDYTNGKVGQLMYCIIGTDPWGGGGGIPPPSLFFVGTPTVHKEGKNVACLLENATRLSS